MPACRQCGKDNPEGTAFCGYCGTPLPKPAADPRSTKPRPAGNPIPAPPIRGSPPSLQPKPFKPEIRTPVFHSPPPPPPPAEPVAKGGDKGGFELIPWSELSPGQRAGRSIAAAVVLILIFFFVRGMLRGLGGARGTGEPSAESSNAPMTDGDRKDGIESLCKVFQIYGLPKNDHDAAEATRNAEELFKLAGNQSPERSAYILTAIIGEFRGGKLKQADCAEAGAPLPTTEETPDNSAPDVQRDNSNQ